MENLEIELEKIKLEREQIIKQMTDLEQNELVKKYIELSSQNEKLQEREMKLYIQIRKNKYSTCNHIWVNHLTIDDGFEGWEKEHVACIKCGLNSEINHLIDKNHDINCFTSEQKIMYSFLENNPGTYSKGIYSEISCDLDLAKAIYFKIEENHPDISDELAIKFLGIALDNIRNIEVSEERKISRAKRLLLKPGFNKWNADDICHTL